MAVSEGDCWILLLDMAASLTAAPERSVSLCEDLTDLLPEVCPLAGGHGIEVGGEFDKVGAQRGGKLISACCQHPDCEESGIAGSRDGNRGYRNTGRHLHDGEQGVHTVQGLQGNGHSDHGERCDTGQHAW